MSNPQNQQVPVEQPKNKVSIASFLSSPKTSQFLDEMLQQRKPEFVLNLISLSESDSSLLECDPAVLMKCALNATAISLPLNKNLGYACIVAYKGVPSFQIMTRGITQLALRTGEYKFINTCDVKEGEISRNKITGEIKFLGEKPSGALLGYMAYIELMRGFSASLYMTLDQLEHHATKYSSLYRADLKNKSKLSKWSDPEERPKMCEKTVLKGLLTHYGLLSTELTRAFELDDETEGSNPNDKFTDAQLVSQDEPDGLNPSEKVDAKPKPFKMQ